MAAQRHNPIGGGQDGPLRVLALATLFPNRYAPHQAAFNRQQFTALAGMCRLALVAPVPWPQRLRGLLCRGPHPPAPFPVCRPVFWYAPRLARRRHGAWLLASAWPALRGLARVLHPQVLLANWLFPEGWAGVRAGRRLGLPVVVQVLGSDLALLSRDPARLPLLRRTLREADAVTVVSEPLRRAVLELGVSPAKVTVLPNGVDTTRFRPRSRERARRRLGLPSGPLILFVGHLVPVKGVDLLVEALARLGPEVRLVLVGSGPLEGTLRRRARALGLEGRLLWAGEVDHARIPLYLAACDTLVLPSRSEGEPNVVLEAIASGRPVVAAAVGGVPGLVRPGENGLLVPPEDAGALARALEQVLATAWSPEAIAAGVAGRTWQASARRLLQVLRAAAGEARR